MHVLIYFDIAVLVSSFLKITNAACRPVPSILFTDSLLNIKIISIVYHIQIMRLLSNNNKLFISIIFYDLQFNYILISLVVPTFSRIFPYEFYPNMYRILSRFSMNFSIFNIFFLIFTICF